MYVTERSTELKIKSTAELFFVFCVKRIAFRKKNYIYIVNSHRLVLCVETTTKNHFFFRSIFLLCFKFNLIELNSFFVLFRFCTYSSSIAVSQFFKIEFYSLFCAEFTFGLIQKQVSESL